MNIILSILLGMLPEVLFLTLFLSYTKEIKEKRIKLFLLISISYFLCIIAINYKVLYFIIFAILIYISLKILYKKKTQLIDIFIINLSFMYIFITSCVCFYFIKDNMSMYYIAFSINRILLFIPFIFRNKFNKWYKEYCRLWNRNDGEKRPIKSITLRNISLIILNVFVFISDIVLIYILNFKG